MNDYYILTRKSQCWGFSLLGRAVTLGRRSTGWLLRQIMVRALNFKW